MTLLEGECDDCGTVTATHGDPPEYCGQCGTLMGQSPITYEDVLDAKIEAEMQGMEVDHVVMTNDVVTRLTSNMVSATEHDNQEHGEDSIGEMSGFDVFEGRNNLLVTDTGKTISLGDDD